MMNRIDLLWLVLAATLCSAGVATAQQPPQPWKPPPPIPDEFDWIQLDSGEWLKGELVAMYNRSLEFESDKLDLLTLDWDDVRQVRTARIVQVRFLGLEPVTGRLVVDGDTVRIVGETERQFERPALLTITAGEPTEANFWSGKVTAGANLRRGNSEQAEVNADVRVLRRTVKSRVGFQYLGNYNVTSDVVATNNHRATGSTDWFVSDRVFVRPLLVEYYRDPFQNVAHRWTVGAAVGYQLLDTGRIDWEASFGPAYQHTTFDSVEEGASQREATPAVAVSTRYTNELSGHVDYLFNYRFLVTKEAAGRYNHHFVTGFEFDSIGFLDVGVSVVWDRIQKPRPDTSGIVPKKDDLRLILGLGFDF